MDFKYIKNCITKNKVPFLLRPAKPSDAEAIKANINEVCAEKIYLYTDNFILTNEWLKILTNSIDENGGNLLIVAEVEKKLVGHLRLFSEWYGHRGRHVGIIGMAIISNWRERGIGNAMLTYAIDWARDVQFEKLTAAVIGTNIRALNLFKKFDFQEEAIRKKQLKIDGSYFDEFLLALFL